MSRVKPISLSRKCVDAQRMALALMAKHGLVKWEFGFSNSLRNAGLCYDPYDGRPGRIQLSVHFVERNGPEELKETILHEIAHALVGNYHCHDDVWKAKCREIGAKPERCYGGNVKMPIGKWQAQCPSCSKRFHRHRRPKYLVGWRCRDCGKERGQLVWREQKW